MNWGKSIVLAAALFMGYIVFLVYTCMKQDVELVDKHYYKEEIEYQQKIDQLNNAKLPEGQVGIIYKAEAQTLEFDFNNNNINGLVSLVRPSDAKKDRSILLQPNGSGKQIYSTTDMDRGLWRIKVKYTDGSREYLKEQVVVL